MESLWITLPATLLLAGVLVGLVVRAASRGDYDDWEGPSARHLHDDDAVPEREGAAPAPETGLSAPPRAPGRR
jgi:cbb3-type cytochrome oxidase maturation protein